MTTKRCWAFLCPLLMITLIACYSDYDKIKAQNDSLRNELHHGGKVVNTVVSVNTLLDSIDATRHVMRGHHNSGQETQNYDERMQELKTYVKQTENKISELEAHMVEKNVNSESYLAIINALKDELSIRNEEMDLIEANAELNNEQMLKGVQLEDVEAGLK